MYHSSQLSTTRFKAKRGKHPGTEAPILFILSIHVRILTRMYRIHRIVARVRTSNVSPSPDRGRRNKARGVAEQRGVKPWETGRTVSPAPIGGDGIKPRAKALGSGRPISPARRGGRRKLVKASVDRTGCGSPHSAPNSIAAQAASRNRKTPAALAVDLGW